MQRGLLSVATAIVLCGLCYLALRVMASNGRPVEDIVLMTCGATLALATIATFFAARAFLRSNSVYRDLSSLSRSVDAAMRDLSARGERETASIGELNTLVKNELELFSSRAPTGRRSSSGEPAPRDNIVALAASRRARQGPAEPAQPVAGDISQAGIETALKRAMAAGAPEISLQPIVSISQGAAIGFEVHAHVQADDETAFDIKKLPAALRGVSQGAFERWLVLGAADAALRQVVASADGLPLHVPISEALMSDSDGLNAVVEALRHSANISDGLVLSLPATVLERNARFAEAVDLLAETGVRLAAEGWSGNKEALEKMKRSGVCLVKLSADRLLGRVRPTKSQSNAVKTMETAASLDMPVIAVDVGNDEDAVSLIDLGVNLMTGDRFSGPRRLRATAA